MASNGIWSEIEMIMIFWWSMADDSPLDSSLLFIFMKTSENRGKSASRKFYADVDVSSSSLNNNQL